MDDVVGQVAVVTGAGSGIGEGLVRHAAAVGMRVVVADIDAAAAARVTADLVDAGADALAIHVDVRDPAQVDHLAAEAFRLGPVRLLVNNAGVEQLGYLWDTPLDNWRRVLDVNVSGVFHGIRSFVPRMIASGCRADVWNVASVAALKTVSRQAPYITSKHAVLGMTEALEVDLQRVGAPVRAAAIVPAAVATRIFEQPGLVSSGDRDAAEEEQATMRRLLATGISPAEAAAEVFAQAARGEFYLRPQPEAVARLMRERGAQLAEGRRPVEVRTAVPEDG